MENQKNETLRDWVKRTHPNQLRLGSYNRPENYEDNYLPESHPCHRCVAYKNRNPRDCDPCNVNPDKDRMQKAGLL